MAASASGSVSADAAAVSCVGGCVLGLRCRRVGLRLGLAVVLAVVVLVVGLLAVVGGVGVDVGLLLVGVGRRRRSLVSSESRTSRPTRRLSPSSPMTAQLGADLDGLVLLDLDLQQRAGDGRGDLGVDLVGGDLEQRLVDGDLVADLLQPAGDGAFGDGLAECGEGDWSRHVRSSLLMLVRSRVVSG